MNALPRADSAVSHVNAQPETVAAIIDTHQYTVPRPSYMSRATYPPTIETARSRPEMECQECEVARSLCNGGDSGGQRTVSLTRRAPACSNIRRNLTRTASHPSRMLRKQSSAASSTDASGNMRRGRLLFPYHQAPRPTRVAGRCRHTTHRASRSPGLLQIASLSLYTQR